MNETQDGDDVDDQAVRRDGFAAMAILALTVVFIIVVIVALV